MIYNWLEREHHAEKPLVGFYAYVTYSFPLADEPYCFNQCIPEGVTFGPVTACTPNFAPCNWNGDTFTNNLSPPLDIIF